MSKTLQQEAEECRKALEEFKRVVIEQLKEDVKKISRWLCFL